MRNVLVLGAGLVARPLVEYLFEHGCKLTIATLYKSQAETLIDGNPNGLACELDLNEPGAIDGFVSEADLVISLVPYTFHVQVARSCIKHRKNMITASYVSPAMKELDGEARDAGILILNEIGLDPGIDHMSAMKIIHEVSEAGGTVESFRSYCGGLPAPDCNNNPWGYKFSWSPRGVLMASGNSARWLEDGQLVDVPAGELFLNHWPLKVEGVGELEAYPNRNSLPYMDIYGLTGVKTMLRGTLRYPGWSRAIKQLVDLGLLDLTTRDDLGGRTWSSLMWQLLDQEPEGELISAVASRLGVPEDDDGIQRMEWAGLFSDELVSQGIDSYLDALAELLQESLIFAEGERDMIVLLHQFKAVYPDGTRKDITSTIVDFGIPGGDSAMARSVSLPAAIAARMILENRITLTGVQIPVMPEVYSPVLEELAQLGIECIETFS